jgi:hypothetical protein
VCDVAALSLLHRPRRHHRQRPRRCRQVPPERVVVPMRSPMTPPAPPLPRFEPPVPPFASAPLPVIAGALFAALLNHVSPPLPPAAFVRRASAGRADRHEHGRERRQGDARRGISTAAATAPPASRKRRPPPAPPPMHSITAATEASQSAGTIQLVPLVSRMVRVAIYCCTTWLITSHAESVEL